MERIESVLFALTLNPHFGKPLKDSLFGYYSARVWPYRIIYKIWKEQALVTVVWIGHRQGAYK
jgi:mRNA-degrading endonuclease RelE of RelBE toxin-antitoxin system